MRLTSLPRTAFALALFCGSLSAQSTLTISNSSFPNGSVGVSYAQTLQATGGATPYTWSVSGQLPPGLIVNPVGLLSGTPTAPGTFSFTLLVVDIRQASASRTLSLTIAGSGTRLSVTTTALPQGTAGVAYSQTLTAIGGTTPYTWSAGQGFPSFLTLNQNSGVVSGTPTAAGSFSFPVQVTDAARTTATGTVTLTINPSSLSITTTPPIFNGTVGVPYVQTFRATGGAPPYTWSITSGSTGDLTLDPSSGNLQGTPLAPGTLNFTVQVSDASRQTASQSYSLQVNAPTLTLTLGSALPAGSVGTSYSQRIQATATGGVPPYTWAIAAGSSLPAGLVFTPSTLTLSGTPTAAGAFTFNLEVRDSASAATSRPVGITINAPGLSFTTATQLPDGILNQPYAANVTASGGQPPYRWSAAGLPGGVTINATTGQIAGTPTAAGNFGVAITVTDNALASISDRFTLNVNLPTPPTATLSGLPSSVSPAQQYPITISLSGTYAAPITGQAILTFAPDSGPTDRTVQFASGGTTANFSIPVGSTTNDAPLAVQTGTVAGTITVSLRLLAGGIDITPNPAPSISGQIARAAPVIRTVTVNRSGSTINLVVTGYSTAREVTQGVFTFNAASGQTLQPSASSITIDMNTLFGNWFQDANNSQFGSVFILTQPFTITGDVNAAIPTKVTLTNRTGSASVDIP
ncbi:MAG: putative Ig domain-containing protein [Candidatus Solibacter sp.]